MGNSPFGPHDLTKCMQQLVESVAFLQTYFPMTVCKFQMYTDDKRCTAASSCGSLHFPSPIAPPEHLSQASTSSTSGTSFGSLALSMDTVTLSSSVVDLQINLSVISDDIDGDASSVGSGRASTPISPTRLKKHLGAPSASPPALDVRIGAELNTPPQLSFRRTISPPMTPLSKVIPMLSQLIRDEELKFGPVARGARTQDEQQARNLMAGATLNLFKELAITKGKAFNWDVMG